MQAAAIAGGDGEIEFLGQGASPWNLCHTPGAKKFLRVVVEGRGAGSSE